MAGSTAVSVRMAIRQFRTPKAPELDPAHAQCRLQPKIQVATVPLPRAACMPVMLSCTVSRSASRCSMRCALDGHCREWRRGDEQVWGLACGNAGPASTRVLTLSVRRSMRRQRSSRTPCPDLTCFDFIFAPKLIAGEFAGSVVIEGWTIRFDRAVYPLLPLAGSSISEHVRSRTSATASSTCAGRNMCKGAGRCGASLFGSWQTRSFTRERSFPQHLKL